jgi:DNA-binding XRE family transcriptional regulator
MKAKNNLTLETLRSEKKYVPPKKIKPEHKEFLEAVGAKLEGLRIKKGISVSDLCKKAEISRYSYFLIQNSDVYWNSQTILNILSALDVDGKRFFKSLK